MGSSESEHFLAALLAENELAWTNWMVSSKQAAIPASTVWDRARKAAHRGDAVEVRAALVEADDRYSPAGRRMLAIGVLNVLASQIARQQERDNP